VSLGAPCGAATLVAKNDGIPRACAMEPGCCAQAMKGRDGASTRAVGRPLVGGGRDFETRSATAAARQPRAGFAAARARPRCCVIAARRCATMMIRGMLAPVAARRCDRAMGV